MFDQVQNKLKLQYQDMDSIEVKNIAKLVRVYKVLRTSGRYRGQAEEAVKLAQNLPASLIFRCERKPYQDA